MSEHHERLSHVSGTVIPFHPQWRNALQCCGLVMSRKTGKRKPDRRQARQGKKRRRVSVFPKTDAKFDHNYNFDEFFKISFGLLFFTLLDFSNLHFLSSSLLRLDKSSGAKRLEYLVPTSNPSSGSKLFRVFLTSSLFPKEITDAT